MVNSPGSRPWYPVNGFELLKDQDTLNAQLTLDNLSFMPRKPMDLDQLTKTYEYLAHRMTAEEKQEWQDFASGLAKNQDRICQECAALRKLQGENSVKKTDNEEVRKEKRRMQYALAKDMKKHLLDAIAAGSAEHGDPVENDAWFLFFDAAKAANEQKERDEALVVDEEKKEMKEVDGLMDDPMGGEVLAVGRVRDKQLKRLMIGDMVVLAASDTTQDIWVGELVLWDDENKDTKAELHWYSQGGKKKNTYRPGWVKETDNTQFHSYTNKQPRATDRYCRFQSHEPFIYWGPKEKFFTKKDEIQKHHRDRIERRMKLHLAHKLAERRSAAGRAGGR
jgi:hypothetical protein